MFQTQHRGSILKGIYIVRMSDIVLCILFVRKKKKEIVNRTEYQGPMIYLTIFSQNSKQQAVSTFSEQSGPPTFTVKHSSLMIAILLFGSWRTRSLKFFFLHEYW